MTEENTSPEVEAAIEAQRAKLADASEFMRFLNFTPQDRFVHGLALLAECALVWRDNDPEFAEKVTFLPKDHKQLTPRQIHLAAIALLEASTPKEDSSESTTIEA